MNSQQELKRLALGVEYDGSRFCGWQSQANGERTVQQELEKALRQVANHEVHLSCAGRTDTGVHGLGQVAHFDSTAQRNPRNWVLGTNVNLPDDVNITWAQWVDNDFHARFSALSRSYLYRILNRSARSAIYDKRATWIYRPLDVSLMQEAAATFVGTHDFSSYRAVRCQAHSPVRTVSHLSLKQRGDLIEMRISADGFLHHMVRNIAGVLISIGQGDNPVGWAQQILDAKDRTKGGMTASSDGLYFMGVEYPQQFDIPATATTIF